jgi:ribonuclease P protein component
MECESAVNAPTRSPEPGANPGPKQRYPRRGRLLRHADFERVYKQGRRHFSAHMTVFYLPRPESPGLENLGMRIGFTVSRALGGAVDRNRMKRRLRESVRACWPAAVPEADVVVNPKKSLLTADFAGLQKEVQRAFEVIAQKLAAKPPARN